MRLQMHPADGDEGRVDVELEDPLVHLLCPFYGPQADVERQPIIDADRC